LTSGNFLQRSIIQIIKPASHIPNTQSAHAILLRDDKYILQLRDNKPRIAAPGQWSLFGGLKKIDETPLETISREIQEELSIQPAEFHYLWFTDYFASFEDEVIRTWFFSSDVSSVWAEHKLLEGQSVGIFHFEDIFDLEMPTVMQTTIERFYRQTKENEII
jgi:8-oxo-dGTP diphosphatase